jgi:NAD(P)-dependent dehydrogenase (short-subunit alcohol dehydrogenase family)
MAKLQDKIALISGGNSGIGLASAKAFIAEGAHVIIVGRNGAAVDAAVADIGDGVTGMLGNVANLGDLDRIYEEVGVRFGHLDIVFANAGRH